MYNYASVFPYDTKLRISQFRVIDKLKLKYSHVHQQLQTVFHGSTQSCIILCCAMLLFLFLLGIVIH